MQFVHRPYQSNECIAAIATAAGEGPVAIIRISGKNAIDVSSKVFSGPVSTFQSHTVHFGKVINEIGEAIDEVLLIVMLAPRTYTGEDTVEIQCHGGNLITTKVLEAVLKAGARAAQPGEFTLRAFMNGKLDLVQAESIQALISAKNMTALKAAEDQLEGTLSKQISTFQKELVDIAAILEAWVDFPEEGLEFASLEEVCASLESTLHKMERLSQTFHFGKMVHTGISLCLAGAPNVGKSSLMNFLLGKERAIVTEIAGTTRDTLEEELRLGGLHFRLIDTAGIRQTNEVIEQEGIRRSLAEMAKADLILLVMDASRNLKEEDLQLLEKAPKEKTVLIWNKIDLPHAIPDISANVYRNGLKNREFDKEALQNFDLHSRLVPEQWSLAPDQNFEGPPTRSKTDSSVFFGIQVKISAKSQIGMKELLQAIETIITKGKPFSKEEVMITNLRHHEALKNAINSCKNLINGLKTNISPEFLSSDMRETLRELGTIIGTDIGEDILSAIFSKFCVGK